MFKKIASVWRDYFASPERELPTPKNDITPTPNVSITSTFTMYFTERVSISPKEYYIGKELMDICININFERKDKKITQKEVSDRLGFKSTSFISRLEACNLNKLEHDTVVRIAEILNVDQNKLLTSLERKEAQ